jgi:hypothetical protein
MAFLDNSGDIILDAVLTDTGRFRLAQGNGSFRIAKFALGDDEVDYSLYNKNDSRGSAYYDLNILSLPVLEAFTNNASSLKSRLLSISRNDLIYLPIMKLNTATSFPHAIHGPSGVHLLAVNRAAETTFSNKEGILLGLTRDGSKYIRIDQGIDSIEQPASAQIASDLLETQYIVEVDNRLINLRVPANSRTNSTNPPGTQIRSSFIDDDMMAVYNFTINANPELIYQLVPKTTDNQEPTNSQNGAVPVVSGPRGTKLEFSLGASDDLVSSDYLFNTLGAVTTIETTPNIKYIDTNIRVTGATTGFRLDIPVRLIKQ